MRNKQQQRHYHLEFQKREDTMLQSTFYLSLSIELCQRVHATRGKVPSLFVRERTENVPRFKGQKRQSWELKRCSTAGIQTQVRKSQEESRKERARWGQRRKRQTCAPDKIWQGNVEMEEMNRAGVSGWWAQTLGGAGRDCGGLRRWLAPAGEAQERKKETGRIRQGLGRVAGRSSPWF